MALQPVQPQESFQELTFPVSGIDSSQEFDRQPPQTTIDGLNVRAFESMTQRGRGGSRPGLTPYIPDKGLPGSVQSLNFVVMVSDQATLVEDGLSGLSAADFVTPGPGGGFAGGSGGPGGADPFGSGGGFLGPAFVGPQPASSPFGGGTGSGASPGPGPDPSDFMNDPSTSHLRRRQPIVHTIIIHRVVRRKGSGIRPTRNNQNKMNPPIARDDFGSTQVGGDSVDIIPTSNDAFLGQPFVTLEAAEPSDLLGGTLSKSGSGANFKVTYTPPETGDGGTIIIPYALMASGNSSVSFATIRIAVDPPPEPYPPSNPPQTYPLKGTSVSFGDGFADLTGPDVDALTGIDGQSVRVAADVLFFDTAPGAINVLFSGSYPTDWNFPIGGEIGTVDLTLLSSLGGGGWNGSV